MSGSDTINCADAMPVTVTKKVVRCAYRVRIKQMRYGTYAVEYKLRPWSKWIVSDCYGSKELDGAIRVASALLYREVFEVSKKGGDA